MKMCLGDPGQNIPPLNLYTEVFEGDDRYYRLKPEFFVNCPESHYLDDIWFATKCRSLEAPEEADSAPRSHHGRNVYEEQQFYMEAIVERKRCGITLWKDVTQYEDFTEECYRQTGDRRECLEQLVGPEQSGKITKASPIWIDQLLLQLRDDKFAEGSWPIINERIQQLLRERTEDNVWPVLGIVGNVFGRLENERLLARGETHPKLVAHSVLLRKLSGMEGDIPFFLYFSGEEESLSAFWDRITSEEAISLTAAGFVEGFISCWADSDFTREVKKAWDVAINKTT
jgi:hypothetical protein